MKIIIIILIFFCALFIVLSITDIMALHSIRQDYVSKNSLDFVEVTLKESMPVWTTAAGEWISVNISLYTRFFISIINIMLLYYLLKKLRKFKSRNKYGEIETEV